MAKPEEARDFFSIKRSEALDRLYRRLEHPDLPKPIKLRDFQVSLYESRGAVAGWEIRPPLPSAPGYSLHIFVDRRFPFTVPKVAIFPAPPPLTYPHIESDGYLCIEERATVIDETKVEGVVDEIMKDALHLVEECFSGRNKKDFEDEILSYWDRAKTPNRRKILSLLDLSLPARPVKIKAWCGDLYYLVASSQSTTERWLENKFGTIPKGAFIDGLLVWSDSILETPASYPKNSRDVRKILRDRCEKDAAKLLDELAVSFPNEIPIIIGFKTKDGPALIGTLISRPAYAAQGKITQGQTFTKGFRPGKLPPAVASDRFFLNIETDNLVVQRIDPSWVLSRDAEPKINVFKTKRVVLVGCGAIGSALSRLLVQAGIGQIDLIDPDIFEWENTGRHALGADAVAGSEHRKAVLLEKSLNSDFPHQRARSFPKKWEEVAATNPLLFSQADVIISTTGEWSADNAMNQYALDAANFPPVIYGWAEAYATAGHSVCIHKGNGCLNCVFSGNHFIGALTDGFEKDLFQAPACGLTFQPFGNINLMPIVSTIAEMAVSVLSSKSKESTIASWLGSSTHLNERGGKWTEVAEGYILEHQKSDGNFHITRPLKRIVKCRACGTESK